MHFLIDKHNVRIAEQTGIRGTRRLWFTVIAEFAEQPVLPIDQKLSHRFYRTGQQPAHYQPPHKHQDRIPGQIKQPLGIGLHTVKEKAMEEPHQHGLIADFSKYSGHRVPGTQVQELCSGKQEHRCIEYIRCQTYRVIAATESNVSGNQIGNVIPSPESDPKEDNGQDYPLENAAFSCYAPKPIEPLLE